MDLLGQSIIIGFFNFLRILGLRQFSTEGFRINDRPVAPTRSTHLQTAFGFLAHYGFFYLVYCLLLSTAMETSPTDGLYIGLCLVTFLVNHGFSFAYNLEKDARRRSNIGTVMLFPYARVLALHLTIMAGLFMAGSSIGVAFFFVVKTVADVSMHTVEHSGPRRAPRPEGGPMAGFGSRPRLARAPGGRDNALYA